MERKLTSLIVDDEEKAVGLLSKLLEDTHQFSEVHTARSVASALEVLEHFEPDLLFLDIKMPGKDGFALLKEFPEKERTCEIVFVTAYDQYALEAFRSYAFAYLLKPVNRQELTDCVHRFRSRRVQSGHAQKLLEMIESIENRNKLRFNTRTGYFFIDPVNILYCEADGNYTTIHVGDKQHVCSLHLGSIEENLQGNGFIRIGRSLIINFKYLSSVDRKKSQLTFEKDGQYFLLDVSRLQLRELEKKQIG
jgi:two-component system, LytTR family, response regulator